tara:strand:- start:2312 stop:2917 length:606 start_codon:yes stop_codon:yes gene_type:complete
MGGITLLSREQEKKKVFFQLGKRFGLPKELFIYLYQILVNSIKHDRSLQVNFHKNILSSYLCGPSASCYDIDDKFLKLNNPFQYRLPIGKGNEWLIYSDKGRKDNIMYEGYYNQLKPRDIICQQIEIYKDLQFIFKYQVVRGRKIYKPLTGMERIKFIDNMGIRLFDLYWEHIEDNRYNIEKMGDSYRDLWFDVHTIYQEQ